ncbi:CocE/NonD family hydrolase [Paenibacillus abyssi]|uniref:X-Pro dipeptidyl-peptidase n=1 Tax=Paenibacillus abyssi TaxID=1340531 RepID=A0A917FPR4_9BACL|nr:CocE/NonD family hydrolase [Paenibacillus abyssi]GGF93223.1 X-Pro dipeptidyl-peptidase [Paenibacillus abyssi]
MSGTRIIIDKDVEIPLRDGTITRADVYRLQDAPPGPVILVRTPYSKEDLVHIIAELFMDPFEMVRQGYVWLVQDVRGRFASEGDFEPFRNELQDGYDSVEWAAAQSWSNGKVGMAGSSYVGMTQWLAATQNPPHLRCIVPTMTASNYHEGVSYRSGALDFGTSMFWHLAVIGQHFLTREIDKGEASPEVLEKLTSSLFNIEEVMKSRPLAAVSPLDEAVHWYKTWLDHPSYDEYWKAIAPKEYYPSMNDIAVFNIGAWFDIFLGGTIENYTGMARKQGAKGSAGNRLLVGPWSHAEFSGRFAEMDFGLTASAYAANLGVKIKRFFDYWLKDEQNGIDSEPPVEVFVMGENVWKTAESYPLQETEWTKFYFHSGGSANTLKGDGALDTSAPETEPEDVYLFDPRNPVPTVGGNTLLLGYNINYNVGPKDQREIEGRSDVLCYSSEVLSGPLEIIGPVKSVLYASSSAKDTDWTVKLVDVHPDGRAFYVMEGILRARYHRSLEQAELLEPGKVYPFEIDLWSTAHVFKAGHKVRVEISSSNFPRYDVNTNTGGNFAEDRYEDMVHAVNTIYHTEEYPSHIVLPVIPRS